MMRLNISFLALGTVLLAAGACGDDGNPQAIDAPADQAVDQATDPGPEASPPDAMPTGVPCGSGVTCAPSEECCFNQGTMCPAMDPDAGAADAGDDGGGGDGGACVPVAASSMCRPAGMCGSDVAIACLSASGCPSGKGCCLEGGLTCKAPSACMGNLLCDTVADCPASQQNCCPIMAGAPISMCQGNPCGTMPDAGMKPDRPPSTGPMPPAGVYGPCSTCGGDTCVMPQMYQGTGSFCSKGCMPGMAGQCPVAAGVTGMGICAVNACVLRCETDADCYGGAYCDTGHPMVGKVCAY